MHTTARVCVDSAAPQSAGHTSANSAATHLYAMQSAVAAQILVLNGFACVQVESVEAAMPSLPMHDTARVCVDSPKPQSVEQAAKSAAIQLYVAQDEVATQTFVAAGFACVQLESVEAAMPLLPMHVTARDCVDSPKPQSFGQEAKSSVIQLYAAQTAVAAQIFVAKGLFCRDSLQLSTATAANQLLSMHVTSRDCVDSPKPHSVGQAVKTSICQKYDIQAAVASHTLVAKGFASAQFPSILPSLPSLPKHATARDCIDSSNPQSVGQAAKSAAIHSYVTQAAVATQTFVVEGFACVQVVSATAMPSVPVHVTARTTVDSEVPQSVGQSGKSAVSQL
jgi:hypothetical protein